MQNSPSITAQVVMHLRSGGPATITELSRSLEVSRTSIENALVPLDAAGTIIASTAIATTGAGRPARRYAFHASAGVVAGVDIGVASVRVLLADLAGRVIAHHDFPGVASRADGAATLTAVIEDIRDALASTNDIGPLLAVGLSLPGIVDDAGRVIASVVIPQWTAVDIGSQLRRALGCPVSVDNGVRLATIAEHHLGVAQLVDDVIYVSVGNRIAVGMILDGRPRRGTHHAAGDIGRHAFRSVVNETGQISWNAASTAAGVFELARSGDGAAQAELQTFIGAFARGIAIVTLTIDPSMIVIGGGLSEAQEDLLGPLRDAVTQFVGLPLHIPLVAARLGATAAAHGALVYAFQQHSPHIYGVDEIAVPPITPADNSPDTSGEIHSAH